MSTTKSNVFVRALMLNFRISHGDLAKLQGDMGLQLVKVEEDNACSVSCHPLAPARYVFQVAPQMSQENSDSVSAAAEQFTQILLSKKNVIRRVTTHSRVWVSLCCEVRLHEAGRKHLVFWENWAIPNCLQHTLAELELDLVLDMAFQQV